MSSKNMLKTSLVVGVSVIGLTLGACASNGSHNSRYGSVYDYESGGDCQAGVSCGAVVTPPVDTRYGSGTVIGGQPVSPGVVYTDCSQVVTMGCGTPVYQEQPVPYVPAPVIPPVYSEPVSCPSHTTPAGDGTCMMTSGSSTYTSTVTTTTSGGTVDCPSNTTRTSDGTCMMTSGHTPSVTIYPTAPTGYVPPVNHTAPVYQPPRK